MSKLNPLGQSMASLFTPEGERLRTAQKEEAKSGSHSQAASSRVAGSASQVKSHQSQDSLGNPNSPGYESWGKKQNKNGEKQEGATGAKGPSGEVISPPEQNSRQFIRLSSGWEKLLLTQKKICEKAKGLFTLLEGPGKYSTLRRGKLLDGKTRGCIVDLDLQRTADEEAARLKKIEEEEKFKKGA
jgi:hypothetical protein